MKLISCYIQGFGSLHEQHYDFSEALNTFVLPNGAGKSTLAAFIKAMLYGMETARKNTFNERAHYLPFDGTGYGGSLTLEFQKDTYRIERTFAPKSQTDDTLRVYRNNEVFPERDIGYFLFALREDSFLRSIFFKEENASLEPTADISARLNPFTGTEDDQLDKILKHLENALKQYENQHGKGLLPDLKNEYHRTEVLIDSQRNIKEQISELYEARAHKAKELEQIQAQLNAHTLYRTRMEQWQSCCTKQSELEQTLQSMEGLRTRYGIPSPEEIRQIQPVMQRYSLQKTKGAEAVLPRDKAERLQALREAYPAGIPDEAACDKLLMLENEIAKWSTAPADVSLLPEEEARLQEQKSLFASFVPEEAQKQKENLQQMRSLTAALAAFDDTTHTGSAFLQELSQDSAAELAQRAQGLLEDYKKADAMLAMPEASPKKTALRDPLLIVLGALFCAGGIACLFKNALWAIPLLAVGAGLAGAGVLLTLLSQKAKKKEAEKAVLLREGIERRREKAQEELNELLSPLGYAPGTPEDTVARLNTELDIWAHVRLQQEAQTEKRQAMAVQCHALQEEAKAYLAPFGVPADEAGMDNLYAAYEAYQKLLAKEKAAEAFKREQERILRESKASAEKMYARYSLPVPEQTADAVAQYGRDRKLLEALSAEQEQKQTEQTYAASAMDEAMGKITALFDAYGVQAPPEEQWDELPFLSERYASLARRAELLHTELEALREQYGLVREPLPPDNTPEALNEALSRLREDLSSTDRQIITLEGQTESLADEESRLSALREQIKDKQQEQKLFSSALFHIKEADEALRRQYIDPIRDRFCEYAAWIEEALGERVVLDNSFRLFFERSGSLRPDGHLSTGQRAVCALCLRLALLDQMFPDEKPFLILDDPFMGMDDMHLNKTGVLLNKISQHYQILYFCCHNSRDPQGKGENGSC